MDDHEDGQCFGRNVTKLQKKEKAKDGGKERPGRQERKKERKKAYAAEGCACGYCADGKRMISEKERGWRNARNGGRVIYMDHMNTAKKKELSWTHCRPLSVLASVRHRPGRMGRMGDVFCAPTNGRTGLSLSVDKQDQERRGGTHVAWSETEVGHP